MVENNIAKGVGVMLLTALFASMAAAGTRYLSAYLPIHVVVCGQYLTGLVITFVMLVPKGRTGFYTARWKLHLLRGCSGLTALYTFYYSLSHIQLVEATLLRSASPLCVPIIIRLWLNIKIPRRRWLPIIIGFIGVIVVLRPTPDNISVWHILALISAFMVAFSMVSTRLLVYTEKGTAVVFYYYLLAASGSMPLAIKSFTFAPWHVWMALVGAGICLYLAMTCYTLSFEYAKPSVISPVSFFGVIFAGFWGWLFWGQIPTVWTFVGIVFIAAGAIMILKQEGPNSPVTTRPIH
ncbi:MAG: DMT family transporter [Proteobacteria bacterium]|nr:DMT family transporter [Pseudomonadota bacterium]MBU1388848.1 DMT family transporter [Pseudomonadota bacterium]MBU1542229.1 DMT family transporter [Pseudomonadota bacterium]MBU2431348.1 DMT family transporter [Pseudomonadota bacterium]MBU2481548.1 DMT family transporter [Pseudomonadota bacterium]